MIDDDVMDVDHSGVDEKVMKKPEKSDADITHDGDDGSDDAGTKGEKTMMKMMLMMSPKIVKIMKKRTLVVVTTKMVVNLKIV
eukprot:3409392-Ditylum_brightwellii.AAC.1